MRKLLLSILLLPATSFALDMGPINQPILYHVTFETQPFLACTDNAEIKIARRRIKRRLKRRFCLEEANPNSCARTLLNTRERDCDGVVNRRDNCPDNSNFQQQDSDLDGVGNACDVDSLTLTPSV